MTTSILFSDTPEHFYQQLNEIIKVAIHQELSGIGKDKNEIEYLKKHEVCRMLQVSKPTIDSHVKKGYYKKYYLGSRVFYNKLEILDYLKQNAEKTVNSKKKSTRQKS
jgi:predicted DNA-binding transcriptional regulator AlpA